MLRRKVLPNFGKFTEFWQPLKMYVDDIKIDDIIKKSIKEVHQAESESD